MSKLPDRLLPVIERIREAAEASRLGIAVSDDGWHAKSDGFWAWGLEYDNPEGRFTPWVDQGSPWRWRDRVIKEWERRKWSPYSPYSAIELLALALLDSADCNKDGHVN